MRIFNKNNKNGNIVILKQTKPNTCGGTDATIDTSAPKNIKSNDMILFDISSRIDTASFSVDEGRSVYYISAFAVKGAHGTFLFLETYNYFREGKTDWSYIKDDISPELNGFVRKYDVAKQNGFHSETHGLPENFGGDINIEYSSGEKIRVSDNQSPVLSFEAGTELAEMFRRLMGLEKVRLPDISGLKAIHFTEERKDGFTKAELVFNADGTGTNKKTSKYDDSVYESEKSISQDTVNAIRQTIDKNGILAWETLPESKFTVFDKKYMVFVFNDKSITVYDNRALPHKISRGFFDIEIELTTKN